MKELDEIDQLFQTTFEGFELTPDPSVKAHIDRALASKKKRRRLLFILFPALLSIGVATTIFYFQPASVKGISRHSELTQNIPSQTHTTKTNNIDKQKETTAISLAKQSEKAPSIHNLHTEEKISGRKNALLRPGLSGLSGENSLMSLDLRSEKSFPENGRNSAILRPTQSKTSLNLPAITDTASPQINTLSPQTQSNPEENRELANASKQDSTGSDSTKTEIPARTPETICDPMDVVTKKPNNWFLAVITGWEGEKKRAFDTFDTTNFAGKRREFASIHSSSFYGRIELNRVLSYPRLNLIAGVGFRSSKVTQYGSLYKRDSLIKHEGVSSAPSDSVVYFIDHQTGAQTYQVNSFSIPLGLSLMIPLNDQFQFRLSGGAEFAYGWMSKRKTLPEFSSPDFRPFGMNAWLRPEFHYTFGKYKLFGFGSFNQAISQQLKWDFTIRRNPAFGAGIGLLIQL